MKKIIAIFVFLFLCSSFILAQKETALQQYSRISYKAVMNGDAISAVCNSKSLPSAKSILGCLKLSQDFISPNYSVTFTYTGCTTIYDVLSNGTPQTIVQDPNNPDRIHIVCMSAPPGDGTMFPTRRTKYYYSTNKGTTWTFVCDVPAGQRSGFGVICLASNGNALISEHNTYLSNVYVSHFNYDAAPGLGSFTILYPSGTGLIDYHWPRTVTTNSILLSNKFVNISAPGGRDSCFWITGTSLGPTPGTFSSWHMFYSDQTEDYSIAKGADGRIGIVCANNDALLPGSFSDLFFMESTDNGNSFGSPTKIFDANISPSGDSLGAFRGIQLIYQGNVPKVVFETVKQSTGGSYFKNDGRNNIRFWSTSLPGSDPNRSIKIADTGSVGYHPLIEISNGSSDFLTCICRPTIGVSSNNAVLFVAFMVPSNHAGGSVDTVSYKDVWFMYSTNNGSNWATPVKINPVTPIRDWSYPSLSLVNDYTDGNYYANLLMLSDSIPGSYVNFSSNGESNAKFMFARINISNIYSISGLVRYSDNNQPATSGYVKAFRYDSGTGNIIIVDSAQIQTNGSYILNNVTDGDVYIGAVPNSTPPSDYVLTYYPSSIYWQNATLLHLTGNLTNINVNVFRLASNTSPNYVSGKVNSASPVFPLKDANLYAKNGNTFVGFKITGSNGVYNLSSLPSGSLKIIADRIGYKSDSVIVNLNKSNLDSVNFYLTKLFIGINPISSAIPDKYFLYQNYPNPFNPATIIRFQTKDLRFVTLKVYNILGKEVATLVKENLKAGEYEIPFNGNNLSSGIYFYKITAGDFTEVKRMVLIK